MSPRLPTPGSDSGNWGEILNEFLSEAHDSTGEIKNDSIGTDKLQAGSITVQKLANVGEAGGPALIDDDGDVLDATGGKLLSQSNATSIYQTIQKTLAIQLLGGTRLWEIGNVPANDTPSTSIQAPGAGFAANNHGTPPIANGILVPPLRKGTTLAVDTENDPHYAHAAVSKRSFGSAYPDYFFALPDTMIAGGSQNKRWDYAVSFIVSGTSFAVRFKVYNTTERYRIKINGRHLTADPEELTGLTAGNIRDLIFTFPTDDIREIEINGAPSYAFAGVWIEPTATLRRSAPHLKLGLTGDSHSAGAAAGFGQSFHSWMANELGMNPVNLALGGSGFLTGASAEINRVPDVLYARPDVLLVGGGYNDLNSSPTYQTMYSAVSDCLAAYKEGLPNTLIIVLGPWLDNSNYSATTFTVINEAKKAAAAQFGLPFIDFLDPYQESDTNPVAYTNDGNHEQGQLYTYQNQKWMTMMRFGTTGAWPGTTRMMLGSWILGTGDAGHLTGYGNADTMVSDDGIHMNAYGHKFTGLALAAEVRRVARKILDS